MTTVITHHPCADGFTARAIAEKYAQENGLSYRYVDGKYNDRFFNPLDYLGEDVVALDFSFDASTLKRLLKCANSVTIVDHHEKAEQALYGIEASNFRFIYDVSKAGCRLAWEYYFPDRELPELVKYVEDRDLWQWKYECTKPVSLALNSYDFDLETWMRFLEDDSLVNNLIYDGRILQRFTDLKVAAYAKYYARTLVLGEYEVPIVNCPAFLVSEVLNLLATNYPFAVGYEFTSANLSLHFRSCEDGENVNKVAQKLGGGGHKHAAGLKIPISQLPGGTVEQILNTLYN